MNQLHTLISNPPNFLSLSDVTAIRQYVIEEILKKSELPPITLIDLYPLFQDHILESDPFLQANIKQIRDALPLIDDQAQLAMLIPLQCVLEMLDGEKMALSHFIKNCLLYDYPDGEVLHLFLKLVENQKMVDGDMIWESLQMLLQKESFFAYPLWQQKNIFVWIVTVLYRLRVLQFQQYDPKLCETALLLWDEARFKKSEELVLYLQTFVKRRFLMYHSTQEKYALLNGMIHEKMENPGASKQRSCSKSGRQKILFLKDRVVNNAPYMVELILFQNLLQNPRFCERYELSVLSYGFPEYDSESANCLENYNKLGIPWISFHDLGIQAGLHYSYAAKFQAVTEYLEQQKPDILIATESYMAYTDSLFAGRLAPLQLYWSHGNHTYQCAGIDGYIKHHLFARSIDIAGNHYHCFNPPFNWIRCEKEPAVEKAAQIQSIRAGYQGKCLLGTFGSYGKVCDMRFMQCIARVLKQNPDAHYLVCGDGNIAPFESFMKEQEVWHQIEVRGIEDVSIYGFVLDVFVNTFPRGQGESMYESMSKAVPVISLYMHESEESPVDGFLRASEMDHLLMGICQNEEAYADLLDACIKDPAIRQKHGSYQQKMVEYKRDPETISTRFMEIMDQLIAQIRE